ncbi:MAG: deoxynucleoside kinase [Tetragenococcus koreensis]|nr:deoxynucleoside kinase [Tetragenococcus koreensis]
MIILAGMIGAGKSLYTKKLSNELGTKAFFEPVANNPILDKYYAEPDKYAFSLQIFFLNQRFKLIKEAFNENNNVLDRSIYEDELFTYVNTLEGNISTEEFAIYTDLVDNMMEELEGLPKKAPDLLVYLDADIDHVLKNIKKRGREYEQVENDPGLLDYYKLLIDNYVGWFENYNKSPKIKIDASQYDVNKEEDWQIVYGLIENKMKEIGL